MTRNTNNNSDQVDDELHEELLYELLLYKKKDIIRDGERSKLSDLASVSEPNVGSILEPNRAA
jgi:hypothetical protein